ncbi:MAG: hydrogenase 3 maturation endopeptidase HyCI [Candidatus Omnitrophota bacterium]|jgi:hydrogenase 3 maturation protease
MSNLLTVEVLEALQPRPGTNLIITAGNNFRSDDGVGPYLYEALKGRASLPVLDAGYTPEDIIDRAIEINPDYIIVIDAADFRGRPGEVRIIEDALIPTSTLSTHAIPLNVITRLIEEETGATTVFLGIQVCSVVPGEGLSPEVKGAADVLSQEIINLYNCSMEGGRDA